MGKSNLSRRDVLSAISIAGGAGIVAGGTTGAIFSDKEEFGTDVLDTANSVAGVVDIDVETKGGDEFVISLPEDDTKKNNPAHIWVRTKTCPEPADNAKSTDVELRLECNGTEYSLNEGTDRDVLDSGTIQDVFTSKEFREGIHLNCQSGCIQPGESRKLLIEQTDSGDMGAVDFELAFFAQQCRYNGDPSSPFDQSTVLGRNECSGDAGPPTTTARAISWIALCGPDITASDVTLGVKMTDEEGDPLMIAWKILESESVNKVTWKHGLGPNLAQSAQKNKTEGIHFKNIADDTSGHVLWDGGTEATELSNSDFCPEHGTKFEYGEDSFESVVGDCNTMPHLTGYSFDNKCIIYDEMRVSESAFNDHLGLFQYYRTRPQFVLEDSVIKNGLNVLGDYDLHLNDVRIEGEFFSYDNTKIFVENDVVIDDGLSDKLKSQIEECGSDATINGTHCAEIKTSGNNA